jgi:hypothetical protein
MRKAAALAAITVIALLTVIVFVRRDRSAVPGPTPPAAPPAVAESARGVAPREPKPPPPVNENRVRPRPSRPQAIDAPTGPRSKPNVRVPKPPSPATRQVETIPVSPLTIPPVAELPRLAPSAAAPPEPDVADAAATELESESQAVRRVLDRYRQMYNGLDARRAHIIWPTVDSEALARIFARLASQSMTFDGCSIALSQSTATAHCAGLLEYVPRVGRAKPQSERHSWTIQLQRGSEGWHIVNVDAR